MLDIEVDQGLFLNVVNMQGLGLPTLWRPSIVPASAGDGSSPQQSTLRHEDSVESSDPGTRRATESFEWPLGHEEQNGDPLCTVCNQACEPKICKVCSWCRLYYHRGCEARFTLGHYYCVEICADCHAALTRLRTKVQEEHERAGESWVEETWLHQTIRDYR